MSENHQYSWRALAVAGALAAVGVTGLAGCGSDDTRAQDPGSSEASSPSDSANGPSAIGSPIQASPSATVTTPATATVYFVGDAVGKPRLFGEVATVPKEAPLAGAAQALMSGPKDGDYRSSYKSGAFGDVSFDEKTGFRVVLLDKSLEQPGSLGKEDARIAVQQLVYTLESVQGVKKAPVTVVADGKPVPLFGIDTSKGVTPSPALQTRALVNVLSPTDGQTVSGKITVKGEANSFEGSVPWSLKNQDGRIVKQGSGQTSDSLRIAPWQVQIDLTGLAPGTYILTASTDDPTGGTEGPGPTSDTKTITVS